MLRPKKTAWGGNSMEGERETLWSRARKVGSFFVRTVAANQEEQKRLAKEAEAQARWDAWGAKLREKERRLHPWRRPVTWTIVISVLVGLFAAGIAVQAWWVRRGAARFDELWASAQSPTGALIAVVVVAFVVWQVRGYRIAIWQQRQQEAIVDEMYDLRWPTLFNDPSDFVSFQAFADMAEMLFVVVKTIEDWPSSRESRVYHLQRKDSASWEMKEQIESCERRLKRTEAHVKAHYNATSDDLLADARKPPAWEAFSGEQVGRIEVAYQRFLAHYRPLPWEKSRVQASVERDYDHGVDADKRQANRAASEVGSPPD